MAAVAAYRGLLWRITAYPIDPIKPCQLEKETTGAGERAGNKGCEGAPIYFPHTFYVAERELSGYWQRYI